MTTPAHEAVSELLTRLSDLDRLLKDDGAWAPLADELLAEKEPEFQKAFWLALESAIESREERIGTCHKGHIYWRLALLSLTSGELTEAIDYLAKAGDEDRRRGNTFSAAIGLQSVLRPLVFRYKGTAWKFDQQIMDFYDSLTTSERREFAETLVRTHDLVADGQLNVIRPEFFTFVQDEGIRKVVQSSYDEILAIMGSQRLATYYSCIFSAGSLLEGMLDDLLSRDSQALWRVFRDDVTVMSHVENSSRLRKDNFESGLTLGEKIMVLRLQAVHARSPVPKPAILLMLIMGEYRDLIHPRRRLDFDFDANAYVAAFVFTLVSHIAHHWWPEQVKAQLVEAEP